MTRGEEILSVLSQVRWQGVCYTLTASFFSAGLLCTGISFLFIENPKLPPAPSSQQEVLLRGSSKSSLSEDQVKRIIERNLFNSEGTVADEDGKNAEGVEENKTDEVLKTDLPLKLIGTIFGGDLASGMAIIENTEKRATNSFMVGDALGGNATLSGVDREKVYIDRGGNRTEFLEIPKVEKPGRRTGKKEAPKSANPLDNLSNLATDAPPENYAEEGFERKGMSTRVSKSFKDRILGAELAKTLADAKATPNLVGGEIRGYTLTRIREDSIYRKLGLQNDDVILEVNGIQLADPAQAIKLLNQLRNENELEVSFERGGSRQTATVDFQ